jgi:hypothetical protein
MISSIAFCRIKVNAYVVGVKCGEAVQRSARGAFVVNINRYLTYTHSVHYDFY